ncbi:hypothetical protein SZ55_5042 [Pseudomonas sp. FeS53a]|nr:hypothetical protein SZ55_5042 [Pseudomonas sp. FeS53a]
MLRVVHGVTFSCCRDGNRTRCACGAAAWARRLTFSGRAWARPRVGAAIVQAQVGGCAPAPPGHRRAGRGRGGARGRRAARLGSR